jgi:hypothetical protein
MYLLYDIMHFDMAIWKSYHITEFEDLFQDYT